MSHFLFENSKPLARQKGPGAVVVQNQALCFVFDTESQHTKKTQGALSWSDTPPLHPSKRRSQQDPPREFCPIASPGYIVRPNETTGRATDLIPQASPSLGRPFGSELDQDTLPLHHHPKDGW